MHFWLPVDFFFSISPPGCQRLTLAEEKMGAICQDTPRFLPPPFRMQLSQWLLGCANYFIYHWHSFAEPILISTLKVTVPGMETEKVKTLSTRGLYTNSETCWLTQFPQKAPTPWAFPKKNVLCVVREAHLRVKHWLCKDFFLPCQPVAREVKLTLIQPFFGTKDHLLCLEWWWSETDSLESLTRRCASTQDEWNWSQLNPITGCSTNKNCIIHQDPCDLVTTYPS